MSRAVSFAIFFSIFSLVLGSVHYFIWARLIRDAALPAGLHRGLTWAVWILFVSLPIGLVLGRGRVAWAAPLLWITFIWLGILFLLFCALLGAELLRLGDQLLAPLWTQSGGVDTERRVFISRLLASAVLLTAGGLGAVALYAGRRVELKKVAVALSKLTHAADGTTIVQWSDVHVGPTLGREFIEHLVERTNELEPDVVVITGDLVDGSVAQLGPHLAPLAQLKARLGVFFVTGNHEYYSGAIEWCRELTRLGVRVLRNECVTLGEGAAAFDLAGIDDYQGARLGAGHGPNLSKALQGRDASRALILLAHQPRAVHEAAPQGVDLQLSGHTHGGQIWPWGFLVRLQQPVVSGLAKFAQTQIYVSNGTGYWGPPMRLGAPAEITQITLKAC